MSHMMNFISTFNEMSCITIILFSKLEIVGKLFTSFVFVMLKGFTVMFIIFWDFLMTN